MCPLERLEWVDLLDPTRGVLNVVQQLNDPLIQPVRTKCEVMLWPRLFVIHPKIRHVVDRSKWGNNLILLTQRKWIHLLRAVKNKN